MYVVRISYGENPTGANPHPAVEDKVETPYEVLQVIETNLTHHHQWDKIDISIEEVPF